MKLFYFFYSESLFMILGGQDPATPEPRIHRLQLERQSYTLKALFTLLTKYRPTFTKLSHPSVQHLINEDSLRSQIKGIHSTSRTRVYPRVLSFLCLCWTISANFVLEKDSSIIPHINSFNELPLLFRISRWHLENQNYSLLHDWLKQIFNMERVRLNSRDHVPLFF